MTNEDFAAGYLADRRRTAADRQAEAEWTLSTQLVTRATEAETQVVGAHHAAAADGYRGAYPLPPVGAVDTWYASGPGKAADARASADYDGAAIDAALDDAEAAAEAVSDDDADGWF